LKHFIVITAAIIALMAGLAGCHKSSDSSDVHAKIQAANTPQNQAAEQAAQAQVARCLPKGNLLTSAGRQAIEDCIAPPAQQQALKACALSAASKEHLTTKAGRQRFEQVDLPACLVKVQKGAAK
jgi:hypothetical protein